MTGKTDGISLYSVFLAEKFNKREDKQLWREAALLKDKFLALIIKIDKLQPGMLAN